MWNMEICLLSGRPESRSASTRKLYKDRFEARVAKKTELRQIFEDSSWGQHKDPHIGKAKSLASQQGLMRSRPTGKATLIGRQERGHGQPNHQKQLSQNLKAAS